MLRRWFSAAILMSVGSAMAQSPVAAPPVAPAPGGTHLPPPASHYPPGVVDVTPEVMPPPSVQIVPANEPVLPFVASFEYLLLRPTRRDLDYALVDPKNDFIPQGSTAGLDWRTDSGFRIGFTWRPRGGNTDVSFTYLYAYSQDSATIGAPQGGLLYPTLTRPGVIDTASTATAFSSFNFNVFDIDLGRTVHLDESFDARMFIGSRTANIGQVLEATYNGLDANQASTRQRLTMDAGGLSLGGEGRWRLGGAWSAYARGRGSLLVADYCLHHTETNFAGNVLVTDISDNFTKVVPVLDIATGLTWTRRNFHFSLGYELSHWFNQVESVSFLDDFAEGKRTRKVSDLSMEAVTFRFGLDF
jgi:hypothetical protein